MQLKSTQNESALLDIVKIISYIDHKWRYKIRGHKIHQITRNIGRLTLRERANQVSSFCSKNEIKYLTYHVPVFRNEGRRLADVRSHEKTNSSILITIKDAGIVYEEFGLGNKVTIVHHLPSVVGFDEMSCMDKELKFNILDDAERNFIDFYSANNNDFKSFCTIILPRALFVMKSHHI